MRIVNWNVERPALKSSKNAARVRYLLGLNPDVVVLTETSQAVDLGPAFSGFFTEPSPRKPREGEAVAAIWIRKDKFRFVQTIDTTDPREAVCVDLDSVWGPFLIYGSIIPYHGWKGPNKRSERWEEHERAIRWHASDWKRLRDHYPSHRMIAAGDYNQHRDGVGRYGTRSVRDLLSAALNEADLSCVTEQDFVATGTLRRRNIDHVCLSSDLVAAVERVDGWNAVVGGERLSDHNGIIVDLKDDTLR
jgi:exonuclease III